MPVKREEGEGKREFLERCIPMEIEAGFPQESAIAMCYKYLEEDHLQKFKKIRSRVSSSNVRRLMYNDVTRDLTIEFNDGSIYTYFGVSEDIFEDIRSGNARPITNDSQTPQRWVKGEKPSVGAAVHQYLIKKGIAFTQGGNFR
jgi:hypothetical protein